MQGPDKKTLKVASEKGGKGTSPLKRRRDITSCSALPESLAGFRFTLPPSSACTGLRERLIPRAGWPDPASPARPCRLRTP